MTDVATRASLVYFFVSDMERSVSFYRDVLGLPLVSRSGDDWAQLDAGTIQLGLHAAGHGELRPGGTVSFSVDDLDARRASLAANGLAFTHEGGGDGGAPRFVEFRDPDGNVLGLVEDPPAGAAS